MGLHILIDGSNVAHSAAWKKRFGSSEEYSQLCDRLVDSVASWSGGLNFDDVVLLVFDGSGQPMRKRKDSVDSRFQVVASYSQSADSLIEIRAVKLSDAGLPFWVVSDDNQIRVVAGNRAERVLSAKDFIGEVIPLDTVNNGVVASDEGGGSSKLGGLASDDVRAKLERLRRGQ